MKTEKVISIDEYFPIWKKLNADESEILASKAVLRKVEKGRILHNGNDECEGLFIVVSGQLRTFIMSDEGKEITLYRLFERDMCMMSAPCILNSIQFAVSIEVEKDSLIWFIPAPVYTKLMETSISVQSYTNELMASRFSEVMWLIEQIMWKSFDMRLAQFLMEESALEENDKIFITHEKIASHLGTAREVVTRMLKYFQNEGIVKIGRGLITIIDQQKLREICKK